MNIKITDIQQRLEESLIAKGFSGVDAKIVANDYLEGELQGKLSHGLMAFVSLLEKDNENLSEPEVLTRTNSMLYIDAKNNLAILVVLKFLNEALQMAKNEGIAFICIKDMKTWLRPGAIAQLIAEHNMVSLVFNNGGKPMTAPAGGYDPEIGTNPIGIGIPTTEVPIVADMATSVRAWGEVRKAQAEGSDLPAEIYYDNTGSYAVKPQDAYSVKAMGDYKGFSLGLMIEIMTGSFMGRLMGSKQMTGDYRVATRGGCIVIFNPSKTTSLDEFKEANSEIVSNIKNGKKLAGVDEIKIPGERGLKAKQKNLSKGSLEVDEELWNKLKV